MGPRRRIAAAVALVAAAAGLAALAAATSGGPAPPARPPRGPAEPPPTPAGAAPAPADEGATFAGVLGINEAVSIPRALLDRGRIRPEQEAHLLAGRARDAAALGAGWVRANTAVYPYLDMMSMEAAGWDWSRPDRWMRAVQEAGLDAVVVLGPWPGNRTAAYTDRYLPADMDAYEAYVRRVVERYDGDGEDDMPGLLRPVRVWEVDNEPDLHHRVPPKGGGARVAPEDFETPAEYAAVVRATARAVHAADPAARVLLGGIYAPHRPEGRAYLAAVLAEEGVREAIDGLSLHCYFDRDALDAVDAAVGAARELAPALPFRVTETGVPSTGRRPGVDEEWQAGMVAAVAGAFLAAGAEAVAWHTLADPPGAARHLRRSAFATHSLMRTLPDGTREPKPAGEVFRRLSEVLASAPRAGARDRRRGRARVLETAAGWLVYRGEVRPPEGARCVLDLRTGAQSPPGRRVEAPAWIALAAGCPG